MIVSREQGRIYRTRPGKPLSIHAERSQLAKRPVNPLAKAQGIEGMFLLRWIGRRGYTIQSQSSRLIGKIILAVGNHPMDYFVERMLLRNQQGDEPV
jgi:hypothetical protein